MRAARTRVLAAAPLAVLLLAGCTTTVTGAGRLAEGVAVSSARPSATPSPTSATDAAYDLILRTKNGMHSGDAVAVKATVVDGDARYTLDGRYGQDAAGKAIGRAVLVLYDFTIEVRTIGFETWVQAPTEYWALTDVPAAASARGDQWVVITQPDTWPAYYGGGNGLQYVTTPDGRSDLGPLRGTTFGGRPASRVTDEDGRAYTIVDGDPPRVVQVRGPGGDADLTYPTDAFTVERPPAAAVVTITGI